MRLAREYLHNILQDLNNNIKKKSKVVKEKSDAHANSHDVIQNPTNIKECIDQAIPFVCYLSQET